MRDGLKFGGKNSILEISNANREGGLLIFGSKNIKLEISRIKMQIVTEIFKLGSKHLMLEISNTNR